MLQQIIFFNINISYENDFVLTHKLYKMTKCKRYKRVPIISFNNGKQL